MSNVKAVKKAVEERKKLGNYHGQHEVLAAGALSLAERLDEASEQMVSVIADRLRDFIERLFADVSTTESPAEKLLGKLQASVGDAKKSK